VSATRILWGQIVIVLLIVLATTWAATQWTAWRLGFQPQLGQPWFHLLPGMPVYVPPAFFWWWLLYDAQPGEDTANSGLRREPDLPKHVAIANEATAPPPAREFDVVVEDTDDSVALHARALSQQLRGIVRQTPLDPDDGLGM
jgi:hypothetical protein